MAEIANQANHDPWPSLDSASWWFARASWVLIGSLVIGALATGLIVWLANVKEHHWDLLRERAAQKIGDLGVDVAEAEKATALAHERIAELIKETARLAADAESSRAEIAAAEARAAEAQRETERLRLKVSWRSLTWQEFNSIVVAMRGYPTEIAVRHAAGDPESERFAFEIGKALTAAGSNVTLGDVFTPEPMTPMRLSPCRDGDANLFARLGSALDEIGLAVTIGNPVEKITLDVGSKPPPI